jgi:hypothetical protein
MASTEQANKTKIKQGKPPQRAEQTEQQAKCPATLQQATTNYRGERMPRELDAKQPMRPFQRPLLHRASQVLQTNAREGNGSHSTSMLRHAESDRT